MSAGRRRTASSRLAHLRSAGTDTAELQRCSHRSYGSHLSYFLHSATSPQPLGCLAGAFHPARAAKRLRPPAPHPENPAFSGIFALVFRNNAPKPALSRFSHPFMLSGLVRQLLISTLLATTTPSLGASGGGSPGGEVSLANWQCLSPDGSKLVFEWRDDLWSVDIGGGRATRLTAHPARDSYPVFSPDGATLYFCSTRAGVLQLFSMPAGGGPATQHSFHSEGAHGSNRFHRMAGTALLRGLRDAPGFRPNRLIRDQPPAARHRKSYLFDETGDLLPVDSPDSARTCCICRNGEQLYRKGYRGTRAPPRSGLYEIESGRPSPRSIKEDAPKPAGRCPGHPIRGRDSSTFRSATAASTSGRHDLSLGMEAAIRQLTHFKDDGIMLPTVIPLMDGSLIVVPPRASTSGASGPPKASRPARKTGYLAVARTFADTSERSSVRSAAPSTADFSPSKLEIAFKAEGDLWVMDTVLQASPTKSPDTPGAEDDPLFSPDGCHSIFYRYDDGTRVEHLADSLARTPRNTGGAARTRSTRAQVTFGPEGQAALLRSAPTAGYLAWVAGSGDLTVAEGRRIEPQGSSSPAGTSRPTTGRPTASGSPSPPRTRTSTATSTSSPPTAVAGAVQHLTPPRLRGVAALVAGWIARSPSPVGASTTRWDCSTSTSACDEAVRSTRKRRVMEAENDHARGPTLPGARHQRGV